MSHHAYMSLVNVKVLEGKLETQVDLFVQKIQLVVNVNLNLVFACFVKKSEYGGDYTLKPNPDKVKKSYRIKMSTMRI